MLAFMYSDSAEFIKFKLRYGRPEPFVYIKRLIHSIVECSYNGTRESFCSSQYSSFYHTADSVIRDSVKRVHCTRRCGHR